MIPTELGLELVAHPSVAGECWDSVELYRMPVFRQELGLAPGQTWPERWNLGRRVELLPFMADDYEARLGDRLALRVMHVLTMAYLAEWKGVARDGTIWRDANLEIVPAWERANDRTVLLREKIKMQEARG